MNVRTVPKLRSRRMAKRGGSSFTHRRVHQTRAFIHSSTGYLRLRMKVCGHQVSISAKFESKCERRTSTPLKNLIQIWQIRHLHDIALKQRFRRHQILAHGGKQDMLDLPPFCLFFVCPERRVLLVRAGFWCAAEWGERTGSWDVEVGELAEERLEAALFGCPVDLGCDKLSITISALNKFIRTWGPSRITKFGNLSRLGV